jgi:hypothetical protein
MVNLTMPASAASILATVKAVLEAHPQQVFVASFSHIASLPAMVLPVEDLIALCHSYGTTTSTPP